MIGDRELIEKYLTPYYGPKNPNLYIEFTEYVGIWSALTDPWAESLPWQIP